MFILTMLSAFSLLVSISFLFIIILALVLLVLVLAAFGTSLKIREMYVKGLLKVFEYATNIKQQKCEELLTTSKKIFLLNDSIIYLIISLFKKNQKVILKKDKKLLNYNVNVLNRLD
jgi:hypothetical protein